MKRESMYMKNLSFKTLPTLLAASVWAVSSQAEETVSSPKPAQLDKVVISAHSFDQGQHEMSQPATLLIDEALDRQRANSLGETLGAQTGIHNASYGTSVGQIGRAHV